MNNIYRMLARNEGRRKRYKQRSFILWMGKKSKACQVARKRRKIELEGEELAKKTLH